VQHTDDTILKKINRGCYTADTIRAIKLLKEGAFKIDLHLMPDLPFSTPEIDLKMAKVQ
jgi:histone acetyltransferase (RNA polymerase elongator complex component)